MKEEMVSILAGLGIVTVIILAAVILKKFFDMTTSGAITWIIIGIGILSLVALLIIEYVDHRVKKQSSEAKKVP